MMETTQPSHAAKTALDRIRTCAATAALAALIVPLAASIAQATVVAPTSPYVSAGTFTFNTTKFMAYTVFNTNGTGAITQIELPEIHAGDINFNALIQGSGGLLSSGFTQQEYLTAQFATSTIVGGTVPGAYVDLIGNITSAFTQNGIAVGTSQTFTAAVPTNATTEANFSLSFANPNSPLASLAIDPPIPDTRVTAVPEPASLALIGAGLLAMTGRRRRKA